MKRKVLLAVMFCGIVALAAPSAWAACGSPTYIGHAFDSFFNCDDTGPLQALVYEALDPANDNSGVLRVSCRFVGEQAGVGGPCVQLGAGSATDHHVTVETDAFLSPWNGCPAAPGLPPKRVIISVIDASGQGVMASVSGLDTGLGYALEGSQQFDTGTSAISPLTCGAASGRPRINSLNVVAGTATINLHQDRPHVFSDCDAGSFGLLLGAACQDSFDGNATALGNIYTRVDLCPQPTDPRNSTDIKLSGWTREAVTPDAAGNSVLTKLLPAPTTPPQCLYIGGSVKVGAGPEGLTGYVTTAQGAASPRAEEVRVAKGQGHITVSWVSRSEINLAAFKVLGDSKAKGGVLELASQSPRGGGGGAAYSVKIDMNSLKGSKAIIVRALLTDGTTVDAAPVGF